MDGYRPIGEKAEFHLFPKKLILNFFRVNFKDFFAVVDSDLADGIVLIQADNFGYILIPVLIINLVLEETRMQPKARHNLKSLLISFIQVGIRG
jgi:hypothetical protein